MTLTLDINQARAYLAALNAAEVDNDFRAIHDTNRALPAIPFRGKLVDMWQTIEYWNANGYGIFVTVNELDGQGREKANVRTVRAQFIDVDGDPDWNKWRAVAAWEMPPSFYVVSSPGRFHAYWTLQAHSEVDRFETIQRKLVTKWDSDRVVVDGPRVMRLPGSYHLKTGAPLPVTLHAGSGLRFVPGAFEWALATVESSAGGERIELGQLAAPSFQIAVQALNRIDPRDLDRGEWLKVSAAFKTAAWAAGETMVRFMWDIWCAQYPSNDAGENEKLWGSVRETRAGWPFLMRRAGMQGEMLFGQPAPAAVAAGEAVVASGVAAIGSSTFLTPAEQSTYFDGCVYVAQMGRILTPSGRFMDSSKFNGAYGGKVFILDATGQKLTDEPWKAATRGQVFTVTKVDHTRFVPTMTPSALIADELGRMGVNTWRPANVKMRQGDASPFLNFLRRLVANEDDVRILLNYFAHCVQRPGKKAFWAPVIQSTEGAGKGVIGEALTYAVGAIYTHQPNVRELADAGSKFNAWMGSRLLIIANEIRVDEKRDMLDTLKPLITEARIEMQAKGIDQEMADNVANWVMFTNYKDAIPITANNRRYAIFYSPLQYASDLVAAGMSGDYFPKLYAWLRAEGAAYVAWFLANYPIDAELDPLIGAHRAPLTSSTAEAIAASLGRTEQVIMEGVNDGEAGFRAGWLSSAAVSRKLANEGVKISPYAIKRALEGLGYHFIGRSGRAYFQEDNKQPNLYHKTVGEMVSNYAKAQKYEL